MRHILLLIITLGLVQPLAAIERSFGKPDIKLTRTFVRRKNRILRFEHKSVPEWGYARPQFDYFYVLPPEGDPKNAPLQVVLHDKDQSGFSVLSQTFSNKSWFHNVRRKGHYAIYLDCEKNKEQDWWWGAKNDLKEKYKDNYTPGEKRILTTIEWVINNFQIDRNRVYLSGIGMGGSGSLGIGMRRGDIFSAINVIVPAGVDHVKARLFDQKVIDPPVVVNFTSIADEWSKGQKELLAECHKMRYNQIFAFCPSGHNGDPSKYHAAAKAFPWREIGKNEAYAVFTNASTDDEYPGLVDENHPDFINREPGPDGKRADWDTWLKNSFDFEQVGALFRWKNLKDNPKEFQMELKMVTKEEVNGTEDLPNNATAEVSLRRLQNFKLGSKKASWTLKRGDKTLKSGEVALDENGLLTIGQLPLSTEPALLSISK